MDMDAASRGGTRPDARAVSMLWHAAPRLGQQTSTRGALVLHSAQRPPYGNQLETKGEKADGTKGTSEIARLHAHTHTHASKQVNLTASPHVKASALEAHARLAPKRSTGRAHTSTAPGTHSSPSDPRPWIRAGVPRRPLVGHARGQPAKTALLGGERVGGPRFLPPRVGGPRFLPPQLLGGAVGGGRRRALVALVTVRVGVRVGVGVGVRVRLGFG